MRILAYILACALVVAFGYWAYQVNYTTQEAVARVDRLRDNIAREREEIAMLQAEWAYLNRPDRLRLLAEQYFDELHLMPLTPQHFGDPGEVAYPPEKEEDRLAEEILSAVLENQP